MKEWQKMELSAKTLPEIFLCKWPKQLNTFTQIKSVIEISSWKTF